MDITDRLHEIANAIADANYSELTKRIPAEPDRDADLVVSSAAREITCLRAELSAYREDAERYRWLRNRIPGSAYRIAGIIYSEGGVGVDAGIDKARKGEGE